MTYCKGDDCKGKKKRGRFNFIGLKPKFCGNCKLDGMINLVNPICLICNKKRPHYNLPTESKGLYCNDCKLPDMVVFNRPKCIACNDKIPVFNLPTESKGLYCNDCKKPDMINVVSFKCIICKKKQPNYNLPTESSALYCGTCKKPDMIDIKNPKCITCKKKRPYFNLSTESKGLYCNDCKLPDMIDVVSTKCMTCNNKRPLYNIPTESKGLYCSSCKLPDMINVFSPKCISNLCEQQSQKDKYCWRCYYFYNPSKKPKRLKIKEEEVINYLKQEFRDIEMITDKALIGDGLCLKNRPDVLIHLNKHSIIIEIDEEQHKWYNPICDEARINNIQEALNRPIIIIRFNPDAYIEKGKKIKSCFNIDKKTGLRTIPKNQEQNWCNRLTKLKDTLILSIDNYTDDPIKIVKLFYDT